MRRKRTVFDPVPVRQKTEGDIREEIKSAVMRLDGVWLHVNTIFHGETERGYVRCGLGEGSPDMVGAVTLPTAHTENPCARFFALELKSKARHVNVADALSPEQRRWHAMMRNIGGFVAVVWSAEEAVAAVERCRRGEVE